MSENRANRVAKDSIGAVVIHRRDLADQHIAALAPKGVPITRAQRHACARTQDQDFARPIAARLPVTHHDPARRGIIGPPRV